MAISTKKSLGKIIAISLASAMAMSSLSAALVSVSAVQDPALASNGNVSLNDDLGTPTSINGVPTSDVEEAIQLILGADADNHIDAIAEGTIDLGAQLTPVLKRPGYIQYTDSNGLKQAVNVDEITYRVSGGGVKFTDDAKTQLQADTKAGSATLTITIKGDVELGGGKSDKSVTLKHTIDIDVHEAGDYGLVAYRPGDTGNDIVTESDLNNLAAYGEDLRFSVIQYAAGHANGFAANRDLVEVGPGGSASEGKVSRTKVVSAVNAVIDSYVQDKTITAEEAVTWKAEVDKLIPTANTDGLIDKTASTALDSLALNKKTADAWGYAIQAQDYAPAAIWKPQELYTEKTAGEDLAAAAKDSNKADVLEAPTASALTNSKLYVGTYNGSTIYFGDATNKPNLAAIDVTDTVKAGALLEENTKATALYWSNSTGFVTSNANGEPAIKQYALKDVTKVERTAATPYTDDSRSPDDTTEGNWSWKVKQVLDGLKIEGIKTTPDGAIKYLECQVDETGTYAGTVDLSKVDVANDTNKASVYLKIANGAKVYTGNDADTATTEIAAIKKAYTDALAADGSGSGAATSVRFYAGTGEDLFDGVGVDWVKGTKGGTKGVTIGSGNDAVVNLKTNGTSGSGSVKVAVPDPDDNTKTKELVLNVKVVKAVDATSIGSVTVKKSGSKTYIENDSSITDEKNISGYEIRNASSLTIENGTIGKLVDISGKIDVNGGRVGDIDSGDSAVSVTEDGIAGNILTAASVDVNEGGRVGKITDVDGTVTLNEGTIDSIDIGGSVRIEGGTVTGDVKAEDSITITSDDEDSNDNPLDTVIGGNVIGSGSGAKIEIDNQSDDGQAEISIGGYVLARYVDTETAHTDGTVEIGSADTTGPIRIKGAVEGEYIVLGGNGLLSLAGVRAANEVDRDDKDGEIVESTLKFAGFNSAINSISNFADVIVDEGTVTVKGAVNATNLTVGSDAQIVADSMTIEEDIIDSGSIVVPVGQLTVTGSVDDSPRLTLLGDLAVDTLAFAGNRGLVNAFESGGLTFKAQRQVDGNYNYLVDKVELGGLTAVGKDVALGVSQTKDVSVALDGVLPEGASIEWSVDDSDVATVSGNGTTATITGKEIDNTTVTAKIVDANGRDLGYEDASFEVNVLGVDTVDSIGGDIDPDDNELDLDTKKKNMTAGDTYTFMVRGNNDVDNLSVTSGDTNVATVALANGADARGALYNITAVADGKTDITVTYQGKTSKIAVKVGGFQLDTTSKKMAPGQVYSVLAKNVPADQAGNVTLDYDSNIVDVVKVNDNYNGRGVLFNITAKAIGDTEVKATYNNETESMAVNVVENTGKLTLDTASYTMPFGGTYTIGVKVEKNGRELSGEEVRAMITSGELVVSDSRTGSIVTTEVQANGNVRVTGRQREGTTYVQFIVMQNGQRVTHASVGVIVQNGATAGGSSVRSISQW